MAFKISPIEMACLAKLEVVSQVLASKLSGPAGREQKCLADTLHEVLIRYRIEASRPQS